MSKVRGEKKSLRNKEMSSWCKYRQGHPGGVGRQAGPSLCRSSHHSKDLGLSTKCNRKAIRECLRVLDWHFFLKTTVVVG